MFHSFEDSSVTIASSLLSSKDTDYLISDLSSEFGFDSDISSSTVSQTTHELEQKVDINSINYDGLNSGYYSRAMQYIPSRKILSYLFPSYGENVDELPQDKLLSIIPVLRRNWMYQCKFLLTLQNTIFNLIYFRATKEIIIFRKLFCSCIGRRR